MKADIFLSIILYSVYWSLVRSIIIANNNRYRLDDKLFGNRRVLNGMAASPLDFLFIVQLHPGPGIVCGGSVITEYHIITSAHCVAPYFCPTIEVYPSTYKRGDQQSIFVTHCWIYFGYTSNRFFDDVAIIRTHENLVHEIKLRIIPLPPPNKIYPQNTPAVIYGWGKLADGTYPDELRIGRVVITDWEVCNFEYKHAASCTMGGICPLPQVPPKTLCIIGTGNHPASACDGDSGGPLVVDGILAGVIVAAVTNGDQCVVGTPNLNVNLARYMNWIRMIID